MEGMVMKVLPNDFTFVQHVIVGIDKLAPGKLYNIRLTDITIKMRVGSPSGYDLTHYYTVIE